MDTSAIEHLAPWQLAMLTGGVCAALFMLVNYATKQDRLDWQAHQRKQRTTADMVRMELRRRFSVTHPKAIEAICQQSGYVERLVVDAERKKHDEDQERIVQYIVRVLGDQLVVKR